MIISEIQKEVHQNAIDHGFWEDEANFGEKMMLIVSEATEAFEHYRDGQYVNEIFYTGNGKPDGIPVEFADIIIRVLDLAERHGMSMEEAIRIKHNYNKTRPHKHGKKV